MLMMFLANVLLNGRLAAVLGFASLTLSFGLKLKREEAFMLQEFPGSYPAYMKRVKRLVPFVI
jgi:protein-S-isoprenylcysteine O-methyltransferase Ste14